MRAVAGNAAWSVGPFTAGPADDKPAIAPLDATHLLVVFAVGGSVARIQGAVLDVNAPGNVAPFDIPGALTLAQSEPNVVRVGARVFVGWKTDRAIPDPNGYAEELWIREIAWNGVTADLGVAEIPLPRWAAHRAGDQRRAALAASGLPEQGAVVAAWDDLGGDFGAGEAAGDVAAELMPVPALRGDGGGGR